MDATPTLRLTEWDDPGCASSVAIAEALPDVEAAADVSLALGRVRDIAARMADRLRAAEAAEVAEVEAGRGHDFGATGESALALAALEDDGSAGSGGGGGGSQGGGGGKGGKGASDPLLTTHRPPRAGPGPGPGPGGAPSIALDLRSFFQMAAPRALPSHAHAHALSHAHHDEDDDEDDDERDIDGDALFRDVGPVDEYCPEDPDTTPLRLSSSWLGVDKVRCMSWVDQPGSPIQTISNPGLLCRQGALYVMGGPAWITHTNYI